MYPILNLSRYDSFLTAKRRKVEVAEDAKENEIECECSLIFTISLLKNLCALRVKSQRPLRLICYINPQLWISSKKIPQS